MVLAFTLSNFQPPCIVMPPTKAFRPPRLQLIHNVEIYDNNEIDLIMTLPRGFTSDGASVPNLLHPLFPPFGMYLAGAFLHDWYCKLANDSGKYSFREYGDQHFEGWVRQCGVVHRAKPMAASVIGYGKWLKVTGKLK